MRWRLDETNVHPVGTTGCALRLNWGETWDLNTVAFFHMSSDAGAPYRRANTALGEAAEHIEAVLAR